MKAIVVRQPWATLIALGVKTIETRPGPPNGPMRPEGVRGLPGCTLERGERIAIVAGGRPAPPEPFVIGDFHIYRHDARDAWLMNANETQQWDLPLGAVVCTVTVDEALPVHPYSDDPATAKGPHIDEGPEGKTLMAWDVDLVAGRPAWLGTEITNQVHLGDFTPGRWGWLLGNVQQTEPIPCKGKQGVFVLPDDVTARLSP